jgi:hypothetical protein
MSRVVTAFLVALLAAGALAQEPTVPAGDKTATADQAANAAEKAASAGAQQQTEQFKPPPGFRTKKFGDKVVYCKKEAAIGTRFKTEQCFDENQLKDYLLAQQQQQAEIDRMRAVCATATVCAPQ